jgi:hypothetical protein
MAAEAGKGSKPRPYSVDQKTFDTNWDSIFGKKDKPAEDKKSADEEIIDHSGEDQ